MRFSSPNPTPTPSELLIRLISLPYTSHLSEMTQDFISLNRANYSGCVGNHISKDFLWWVWLEWIHSKGSDLTPTSFSLSSAKGKWCLWRQCLMTLMTGIQLAYLLPLWLAQRCSFLQRSQTLGQLNLRVGVDLVHSFSSRALKGCILENGMGCLGYGSLDS